MDPTDKVVFETDDLRIDYDGFWEVTKQWSGVQVIPDESLPPWGCRVVSFKAYMGLTAANLIHSTVEPLKGSAN